MKAIEKARKYLKEGKVFKLKKTRNTEYYICEGNSGVWEVKHDIRKDIWSCNCKNIRNTPCCHILCTKMFTKMADE